MKIALIWPFGYDSKYVVPLSLSLLKSNLDNQAHDVKIIDCSLHNWKADSPELGRILTEFSPDMVGVSCWSTVYEEGLEVLKLAKTLNHDVITVAGGTHANVCAEEVISEKSVDYVMCGEAELTFPLLVKTLETRNTENLQSIPGLVYTQPDGTIGKNDIHLEEDLDALQFPDYEAFDLETYIENGYRFNTAHKLNAPVWVTRGCPYNCTFCSAPIQNGKKIRRHSVDYMMRLIRHLYDRGIRHISIIDDNFTFDVDYAKEFCRAVLEGNFKSLHFGTPNGIRIERFDTELLDLMKKCNWENIVVAPESGSPSTLKKMKKSLNPDVVPEKITLIKKAGFKVHGFFIIGYPDETEEDIAQTQSLLRKCKFDFFFINNFQPLPGTACYNDLVSQGAIPEGQLPKNFSSGERCYCPPALKDFNFPKFVLNEYMHLAMSNPLNVFYMIRIFNPKLVITKLMSNFTNMIRK